MIQSLSQNQSALDGQNLQRPKKQPTSTEFDAQIQAAQVQGAPTPGVPAQAQSQVQAQNQDALFKQTPPLKQTPQTGMPQYEQAKGSQKNSNPNAPSLSPGLANEAIATALATSKAPAKTSATVPASALAAAQETAEIPAEIKPQASPSGSVAKQQGKKSPGIPVEGSPAGQSQLQVQTLQNQNQNTPASEFSSADPSQKAALEPGEAGRTESRRASEKKAFQESTLISGAEWIAQQTPAQRQEVERLGEAKPQAKPKAVGAFALAAAKNLEKSGEIPLTAFPILQSKEALAKQESRKLSVGEASAAWRLERRGSAPLTSSPLSPMASSQLMQPELAELNENLESFRDLEDLESGTSMEFIPTQTPRLPMKHVTGSEFLDTRNALQMAPGLKGEAPSNPSTPSVGPMGASKASQIGTTKAGRFEKNPLASPRDPEVKMAHPNAILLSNEARNQPTPRELTARVVPGAMSRERITTDSLNGMSIGIHQLKELGGGEMRVRLKPENLGELHVRVSTNGRQVGLQIEASDEKAKNIIEESISSLRESLRSQNLTLSHLDVLVKTPEVARTENAPSSFLDYNQQNANSFDASAQNSGQQHARNSSDFDGSNSRQSMGRPDRSTLDPAAGPAPRWTPLQRGSPGMGQGRLDVMA